MTTDLLTVWLFGLALIACSAVAPARARDLLFLMGVACCGGAALAMFV